MRKKAIKNISSYFILFKILSLTLITIFCKINTGLSQGVSDLDGGVCSNGKINALVSDSVSGTLYIGGEFKAINGIDAVHFAAWDGISWSNLNCFPNDRILSMIKFNNELYIAGEFTSISNVSCNHVAKYDGASWIPVSNGLTGNAVINLNIFQGNLYAVCTIPFLGNYLYRFDGSSWIQIPGLMNNYVKGTLTTNNKLYVYGSFSRMSLDTAYGMAAFDGSVWTIMPDIPNGTNYVNSAVEFNNTIYIARTSGGSPCKLVGTAWVEQTSAPDCQELFIYNNSMYRCDLTTTYTVFKDSAGMYPIFQTFPCYHTQSNDRFITTSFNNILFTGGSFYLEGNPDQLSLLKFDGSSWTNIGRPVASNSLNLYGYVFDLFCDTTTNQIYAGGEFDFAGSIFSRNIARWDGTQWHAMGEGLNGKVRRILKFNGSIYAFGYFDKCGSSDCNYIARWDGNSWQSVGFGANDEIADAAVVGNLLYISGPFTEVDSIPFQHYAAYDGTSWNQVASVDLISSAKRLVNHNGVLWAATVDTLGGSNSYLAELIGTTWSIKTTNITIPSYIHSMVSYNGELYFSTGTWDYFYFYKWNGDSIVSLGTIFNDICTGGTFLVKSNNLLYFSCQNRGIYKYENNTFKGVAPIFALCSTESDTLSYIGGAFPFYNVNQQQIYANGVLSLDFNNGYMSPDIVTDTICAHDFAYLSLETNLDFAKYKWYFPGGSPDTAINANPIIYYSSPGSYPAYIIYTDMAVTDTIFLQDSIIVNPCLTGMDEITNEKTIVVYPNPATNQIRISNNNVTKVELYDGLGKCIRTATKPFLEIADLRTGIYYLRIFLNDNYSNYSNFKISKL